jgi:DNA-binding NarL/FixJ family response regulator
MPQRTILLVLVGVEHLGWAGLRATLHGMGGVRVLREAIGEQQALSSAAELHADVIVVGTGLESASPLLLVGELRRCSPTSRIVVLGDDPAGDELLQYLTLNASAYLLWDGLSPAHLHRAIELVIDADVVMANRTAVESIATAWRLRSQTAADSLGLSVRERSVLCYLAAGLTRQQIAAAEAISLRSVERIVADLGDRLNAPSSFVMGVRAASLGLLPAGEQGSLPAGAAGTRATA